MSNCVTTPQNAGGQPRTPVDHHSNSAGHDPKAEPPSKLLRDEEVVPGPCQILRGTTGNDRDQAAGQPGPGAAPPQVSSATTHREPKLPKLIAVGAGPDNCHNPKMQTGAPARRGHVRIGSWGVALV
ncbi:hypothetical protein GCM10010335_37230 [Streptomyces galbus]|nr:hypothetical protein GCM10010335_37230 [Streptomyces galbus]